MLSALSAFVTSLTGKVVLGTAVVATSVGGLHAGHVVDVPGLPDQATERQVATSQEVDAENAAKAQAATDEDLPAVSVPIHVTSG
jgi:prephenate dehydrogenase